MTTTNDGRTRDANGRLLEETGIAAPRWPTDWEYVSRGPYRIQRHDYNDPPMAIDVWDIDILPMALGVFVEVGVPERVDVIVVLLDEGFQVVLGYSSAYGGIGLGTAQWWGTGETFDYLNRWSGLDPVDLAIWESLARTRT